MYPNKTNTALRIAQITDCHLPGDPKQTYRGINAHQNLQALLKRVAQFEPDVLLATGDLSEDASPASYQALEQYFRQLNVPVLALPGNHDEPQQLEGVFPDSPVDTVVVSSHAGWQIIRLNSCLPGKPEGRLSAQTLKQLAIVLSDKPGLPCLIALHHQPVAAQSPWIDKYRLRQPEALLQLVDKYARVKVLVWGHVHRADSIKRGSVSLLAGPSSAINSLTGTEKFSPDPIGPACRWLILAADGGVETGIITL